MIEGLERRWLYAAVPRPDHVVVVVEENEAEATIIGSAQAPYINALATGGALFTQSYGITHPSQPNYLALFSGATQGVTSDAIPANVPFATPNLAASLRAAGATFGGYAEGLPDVGIKTDGTAAGGYRRKHNPWVNWQDDASPTGNHLPSSVSHNLAAFPADYTKLPAVSFVIPDLYHDAHDDQPNDGQTPLQTMDQWLRSTLGGYATWAKSHNSLLVLTWDEDDSQHANRIPTVIYGQHVVTGAYAEHVTHYNLLRTLTDAFGAAAPGAAATAVPITDIWDTPTRLTGTTFGTPGSYHGLGNTAARATDGKLSTYFDAAQGTGAFVGLDLGTARRVTAIAFAPRAGFAYRMAGGRFQASDTADFSKNVVTAYTVASTPADGKLTTVTVSVPAAYRYWRYVGPANSSCNIAEFQLFGT